MENALDALKMAFAMLVLVIALSTAIYALNVTNSTVKTIVYMNDKTNFFDNFDITAETKTYRIVDVDTIVPTLYRYYKENFSVKIYDGDKLVQIFDINTEGKVNKASALRPSLRNREQNILLSIYGDKNPTDDSTNPYLFEAPWIGNTNVDTKTRVDLYVNGQRGYINNVLVDYTKNNLQKLIDKKNENTNENSKYGFVESFVKYTYSGDTISVGEGQDIETITGSKQPEDKIEITYTLKRIDN